jgi:hypothetical protein
VTNGPDLIHAPWSAEQVTALNAFQHHGRMHPFTCGATHASGQSPVLVATNSGWVCPDPQCVYRQDWAHAFMAQGAAVPVPPPTDQTAVIAATVRACAEHLRDRYSDTWTTDAAHSLELNAARIERGEPTALLRRLAAEAQPTTKPPGVQPRHTCHDQKSAPGWDWECQWCSTLPDDIGPAAGVGQDGAQPQEPPVVAYRFPGGHYLYCTRHTDELGDSWTPLLSDDLPDGGLCAHSGCGVDVLIPQDGAQK